MNKAVIGDSNTGEDLLTVEYKLRHKVKGDPKANIYTGDDEENLSEEELLDSETWEVEILNVSDIVQKLLELKPDIQSQSEAYQGENGVHIHTAKSYDQNTHYRIMCFMKLLESEKMAMSVFHSWLLMTAGLLFSDDFVEANEYMDKNEDWHHKLSSKYTIRV